MTTLSPQGQTTINAGLALLFDGLSEAPAGLIPTILADIKTKIDLYDPKNPASFQQWLNDVGNFIQAIAVDSGNATAEKYAAWTAQITQMVGAGKSPEAAIFLSLFKKHVVATTTS